MNGKQAYANSNPADVTLTCLAVKAQFVFPNLAQNIRSVRTTTINHEPINEPPTSLNLYFQAFLIAFTSSFVPRLYYRYTRDSTLSGFINFTLATSPLSYQQQHNTSCRYASAPQRHHQQPHGPAAPGRAVMDSLSHMITQDHLSSFDIGLKSEMSSFQKL